MSPSGQKINIKAYFIQCLVWSEPSSSAWRDLTSLVGQNAPIQDSDQTVPILSWSEAWLDAHGRRYVFQWIGSYDPVKFAPKKTNKKSPGPNCSKLTMSSVNVSLKLWSLNMAYMLIFLHKRMWVAFASIYIPWYFTRYLPSYELFIK